MRLLNSAENVLDVLFVWHSEKAYELGLNEISRITGINKSTVYKILQSLKLRNLVEQNPENKKYKLGVGTIQLGNFVLKNLELREVAHPLLKQLAHMCQNTVTLGIRNDDHLVFIDRVDGRDNVRFFCEVGKRVPYYGGAAAKALFAHLEDSEIEKILDKDIENKKFTENTLGKNEFLKEIETIRKKGFAISDEEVDIGVLAIGVPIFNHEKKAIAGMALAGLKQTFTPESLQINKRLILEYSNIISMKMGFDGTKNIY